MPISIRAVSGFERISDEIELSVLNRKCGLIWLDSASMRAAISSFSCSSSWCSIRALFQILMGMAIASTVAMMSGEVVQAGVGLAGRRAAVDAEAVADGQPDGLHGDRREDQHDLPVHLERADVRQTRLCSAREHEGREVPDVGLRAQLAQPAARKAAPDGEGERAEFAREDRRHPAHEADEGAGIGAGDEAGQEAASSVRSAAL